METRLYSVSVNGIIGLLSGVMFFAQLVFVVCRALTGQAAMKDRYSAKRAIAGEILSVVMVVLDGADATFLCHAILFHTLSGLWIGVMAAGMTRIDERERSEQ